MGDVEELSPHCQSVVSEEGVSGAEEAGEVVSLSRFRDGGESTPRREESRWEVLERRRPRDMPMRAATPNYIISLVHH